MAWAAVPRTSTGLRLECCADLLPGGPRRGTPFPRREAFGHRTAEARHRILTGEQNNECYGGLRASRPPSRTARAYGLSSVPSPDEQEEQTRRQLGIWPGRAAEHDEEDDVEDGIPEPEMIEELQVCGLQMGYTAIHMGDRCFSFVLPYSLDEVLEKYISEDNFSHVSDPFWCRLWPSAVALAQQLLQRPELVRGKRVADLGAGLGLAGLAAAAAGAREVVMLDRDMLALSCCLLSAQASAPAVPGLRCMGIEELVSSPAPSTAATLRPATSADAAAGTPGCLLRAERFDWSEQWRGARFDAVLASDVLYEKSAVEPLAAALRGLLRRDGTSSLLLADPPDRCRDNRSRFLQLLRSGGDGQQLAVVESSVVLAAGSPVQLLVAHRSWGRDTIGVKAF